MSDLDDQLGKLKQKLAQMKKKVSKKTGRPLLGDAPLTKAERQRRWRAKKKLEQQQKQS